MVTKRNNSFINNSRNEDSIIIVLKVTLTHNVTTENSWVIGIISDLAEDHDL